MKSVQVCLVSDQPIPNLTTVLQFSPAIVVLLYTADKTAQKNRLEKVIKARDIQTDSREILPYDMANVIVESDKISRDYKDCDILLNITGGTKIGTLGSFQSFYSAGKKILYVNTSGDEILQISPETCNIPIDVTIRIRDYLEVYGFTINEHVKDDRHIYQRREVTGVLARLAARKEWLVGKINSSFVKDVEKLAYPYEIKLPEETEIAKLLDKLASMGMGIKTGPHSFLVPDRDVASYLRGFWFEEYVYLAAKSLAGLEVLLNIKGKWDTNKDQPKNEFDVMLAKGNRLYYISCKTANGNRKDENDNEGVGREYLYELSSLGDRALGLFGRKFLASVRTIKDPYVRERAKLMNIDTVFGARILELKSILAAQLNIKDRS